MRKRLPIKWVRDLAKKDYNKGNSCEICEIDEGLQLHHPHSMTDLFVSWCERKGYSYATDEDVIAIRQEFIDEHRYELYEDVITLCKDCHEWLHKVYGLKPDPSTVEKQKRWVKRKHDKLAKRITLSGAVHSSTV